MSSPKRMLGGAIGIATIAVGFLVWGPAATGTKTAAVEQSGTDSRKATTLDAVSVTEAGDSVEVTARKPLAAPLDEATIGRGIVQRKEGVPFAEQLNLVPSRGPSIAARLSQTHTASELRVLTSVEKATGKPPSAATREILAERKRGKSGAELRALAQRMAWPDIRERSVVMEWIRRDAGE